MLGSFADVTPGGRRSIETLRTLVSCLISLGWDAFLSGDPRSREIAPGHWTPRQLTRALERCTDLSLFVASRAGRPNGWVTELATLQITRPETATRRVVLVEVGYPLSQMMDPMYGGLLAEPPVLVIPWRDGDELCAAADRCARFLSTRGRLPTRTGQERQH
ncbi:MAG TPA: hypothetical protein VGB42_11830 [Candidatus Thermoplasmatota archaeon]